MKTIAIFAALLSVVPAAIAQTRQDPIYNPQNQAAYQEAQRRAAEAAAKQNQPAYQKDLGNNVNAHTGAPLGGNGVTIEKKY